MSTNLSLQPCTKTETAKYPARKSSLFSVNGRWLRRVGVAVAASAAFWLSGCDILTISGDAPMPSYFVCADSSPDAPPQLNIPGSYWGDTCRNSRAWARIDVEDQETVSIGITGGGDCGVMADIIDPEGHAIAAIGADGGDVELDLSPGRWLVSIDHDESCDYASFDLHIDSLEE